MLRANDNLPPDIKEALDYIVTGGIGEIMITTDWAWKFKHPKVQSDPQTIIALCILAQEAIEARIKAKEDVTPN